MTDKQIENPNELAITRITTMEDLRQYVGQQVYFRWEDGKLGAGKLIYTADENSPDRHHTQKSPGHAGMDQWRTDQIGLEREEVQGRLRQWGETAVTISVRDDQLHVAHDRTKVAEPRYEILLEGEGLMAVFVRNQEELDKCQVSNLPFAANLDYPHQQLISKVVFSRQGLEAAIPEWKKKVLGVTSYVEKFESDWAAGITKDLDTLARLVDTLPEDERGAFIGFIEAEKAALDQNIRDIRALVAYHKEQIAQRQAE